MNLHKLASITSAVNPRIPIVVQHANGYSTAADGTQIPTYTPRQTVQGSPQPLSAQDLQKLQGLNIEDVTYKVYLDGDYEGVFRKTGRGGDLLTWGGNTYLVTTVLERWPDWTCIGVTLQIDG